MQGGLRCGHDLVQFAGLCVCISGWGVQATNGIQCNSVIGNVALASSSSLHVCGEEDFKTTTCGAFVYAGLVVAVLPVCKGWVCPWPQILYICIYIYIYIYRVW